MTLPPHAEADLQRIFRVLREGVEHDYDEAEEAGQDPAETNLRLDAFAVVCIWQEDSDDHTEEYETTSIYSSSRRHHVHLGILHSGLQHLAIQGDDVDA